MLWENSENKELSREEEGIRFIKELDSEGHFKDLMSGNLPMTEFLEEGVSLQGK